MYYFYNQKKKPITWRRCVYVPMMCFQYHHEYKYCCPKEKFDIDLNPNNGVSKTNTGTYPITCKIIVV